MIDQVMRFISERREDNIACAVPYERDGRAVENIALQKWIMENIALKNGSKSRMAKSLKSMILQRRKQIKNANCCSCFMNGRLKENHAQYEWLKSVGLNEDESED
jgi:hypothetical protein